MSSQDIHRPILSVSVLTPPDRLTCNLLHAANLEPSLRMPDWTAVFYNPRPSRSEDTEISTRYFNNRRVASAYRAIGLNACDLIASTGQFSYYPQTTRKHFNATISDLRKKLIEKLWGAYVCPGSPACLFDESPDSDRLSAPYSLVALMGYGVTRGEERRISAHCSRIMGNWGGNNTEKDQIAPNQGLEREAQELARAVGEKIGYQFLDPMLLLSAFSEPSTDVLRRTHQIELIGDKVINCLQCMIDAHRIGRIEMQAVPFPVKYKAYKVACTEMLSSIAERFDLIRHIRRLPNRKSVGKITANVTESLIGVAYLQDGFNEAIRLYGQLYLGTAE